MTGYDSGGSVDLHGLKADFVNDADILASKVGMDPCRRHKPSAGWTQQAVWYDHDDRLLAVVGAHAQTGADLALAHGLALRGDRPLHLVLPDGWVEPTRRRLPWLAVDVQLWRHRDGKVDKVRPPRPGDQPYPGDHDHPALHLSERTDWVSALMAWAGANPELDPGHRDNVRAWHCRGTRVLALTRTKPGLRVTAGIAYGDPGDKAGSATVHDLTGPLTRRELVSIQQQVQDGIAARLDGAAGGANEHWLQAEIRRHPDWLHLEQPVLREVPAWRPVRDPDGTPTHGYGRGFLDLVGLDPRGDLHLVETKLAADDMLVLQGLDYLAWSQPREHTQRLTTRLGCRPAAPKVLHFVIGDKNGKLAIGKYAQAQARALRPDIRWQFTTLAGWHSGQPTIKAFPPQTVPAA